MWLWLIPVLGVLSWWLSRRSLSGLGHVSRWAALAARVAAIALLAAALAEPQLREESESVAVTVVVDASRSIPSTAQTRIDQYIANAQAGSRQPRDKLGIVTAAEDAYVQSSPSTLVREVQRQSIGARDGTNLDEAVRLAIAASPDDSAGRILLISDGNETDGSLLRAADQAKAVGVPVDVLPVEFEFTEEVIVEEVQSPAGVRVGETVSLRIVLTTTEPVIGRLSVRQNGDTIDLDPDPEETGSLVTLDAGRHVLSVPVTPTRPGPQQYDAVFEPLATLDSEGNPGTTRGDSVLENNRASAITFVGSEGSVLVVSETPEEAQPLEDALNTAEIQTRLVTSSGLPVTLPELAAYEAIVLVNQSAYNSTAQQQELLRQYVHDTGGGLVMIGGPETFGAGGWIGSPLADALPIRLDPPQKRQMPRGALAIIVHSVEIPRGVFYGKEICRAAVDALSRLDLVGIIEFRGFGGTDWVYPMSPVGDRVAVNQAINGLQFGDMPSFDPSLRLALAGLQAAEAGQKHCVIVSDGDPTMTRSILRQYRQSGITISAVGVNPHSPSDLNSLRTMANETGGQYYTVGNNALETLPQIFVKEAQTLRRALLWEGEAFSPAMTRVPTETMRGIGSVPPIEGYVVAADRDGLSLVTLRGKEEDPIAAQWQYGLGRVGVFTSDATTRWASGWIGWQGYKQFWEQQVRWAMRP
ncbi:MAG: VWA domain-containing protein, partial [Planctomycetota bacterium]